FVTTSVSPFPDGGLDEPLCFAVGPWRVGPSALGSEVEIATGLKKFAPIEARTVVGKHAAGADAKALEVSDGLSQEVCRRGGFFVPVHGGKSQPRVIVDGNVEKLPAGAASFVFGIAGDAVARLDDAGELLDVEMQQIARRGVLVADDGDFRFQHVPPVELQTGQDAAHGGLAQAQLLSDADPGPAFPPQPLHALDQFRRGASRGALGTRRSIPESRATRLAITPDPLGGALPTEPVRGGRLAQAQPAFHDRFC